MLLLQLLGRGRRGSMRVSGAVQLFYFKSVAVVFLMYIAACIHIAKAYLVAILPLLTRLHAVEHNTTSQPLSLLRGFVALHAEPSSIEAEWKPMRNSKLPTPLAKITSSSFEDALPPLVEDKSPTT